MESHDEELDPIFDFELSSATESIWLKALEDYLFKLRDLSEKLRCYLNWENFLVSCLYSVLSFLSTSVADPLELIVGDTSDFSSTFLGELGESNRLTSLPSCLNFFTTADYFITMVLFL